ncbi:MAG: hypothetical protein V4622_12250 [Bacteroidota bacterium]
MNAIKTYRFIGLDSFTLLLKTDIFKGNELQATIPSVYLKIYIDGHLKMLKYAYIPSLEIAFDWLDRTAKLIFTLKDSYFYFYKYQMLRNTLITRNVCNYILTNMETLKLIPATHYCLRNRPIDFFIINANTIAEWHVCRNSFKKISANEFKVNLLTDEMKEDFSHLVEEGSKAYKVTICKNTTHSLLFSRKDMLLMLVSH